MSAPDMFSMGGRQDADTEILALFREWCAAWRASSRCQGGDDECDAALAVADKIAERIYDAPVQGVVGLAIKAFMVGQGSGDLDHLSRMKDDACSLGTFTQDRYSSRYVGGLRTGVAHLYMESHALRGLLASAAALLPELRPLVEAAVESPLTLPIEAEESGDAA